MIRNLCIVVPVYDDWASFETLVQHLDAVAAGWPFQVFVSAVDDGSSETLGPAARAAISQASHLAGVEVVHLALNLGHQRAIAVGLCAAVKNYDPDAVVVMDSDGEDPPESIGALLAAVGDQAEFCAVAKRRKRTEKLTFKAGYIVYKFIFRLVTGKEINFGNFSLISRRYVRRLVMLPDLWNNLAAALLRSRTKIKRVPVDRGHRYTGTSKMNFISLIVHGFSGISVYAETIFVRLLLLTACLATLTVLALVALAVLRIYLPSHATPGWATTVGFGLIILVVQALFTAITSILMQLNGRVQRLVLPIEDFPMYIESRSLLAGHMPQRDSL